MNKWSSIIDTRKLINLIDWSEHYYLGCDGNKYCMLPVHIWKNAINQSDISFWQELLCN